MGQGHSVFQEDQFECYTECTYFSHKDILRLYKVFSSIDPVKVNPWMANVTTRLSFKQVQTLAELSQNPFKNRICQVFSTDGEGIHFEDFLDMMSVLSSHAPWELKSAYAFRIYDYNEDAAICIEDVKQVVINLTDDALDESELDIIAANVMEEADIHNDGKLTYTEFEHAVGRAPDFVNLFHVTV